MDSIHQMFPRVPLGKTLTDVDGSEFSVAGTVATEAAVPPTVPENEVVTGEEEQKPASTTEVPPAAASEAPAPGSTAELTSSLAAPQAQSRGLPSDGTAAADAITEFTRPPFPQSPSVGAWLRSATNADRIRMTQSLIAAVEAEASSSSRPGSKKSSRRPSQIEVTDKDATGTGPTPMSPSVGAWLQQAPPSARLRLNELASSQEPSSSLDDMALRFSHSPSVGAWLRSAPQGAHRQLLELGKNATPQTLQDAAKITEAITEQANLQGRTPFNLSPSVGNWLRSKPVRVNLAAAIASTADVPEVSEQVLEDAQRYSLTRYASVWAWLQIAPQWHWDELSRAPTPTPAVASTAPPPSARRNLRGDHRTVPGLFEPIYARFELKVPTPRAPPGATEAAVAVATETVPTAEDLYRRDLEALRNEMRAEMNELKDGMTTLQQKLEDERQGKRPAAVDVSTEVEPEEIKPELPKMGLERPPSSGARADQRFMTNAGATREQVVNFAQSMMSNIFRSSNTMAMQRTAAQGQLRHPWALMGPMQLQQSAASATGPTAADRTNAAMASSSSAAGAPATGTTRPPPAPGATGSMQSTSSSTATKRPADGTTTMPRPAFRKQFSPIPAEDNAFFD